MNGLRTAYATCFVLGALLYFFGNHGDVTFLFYVVGALLVGVRDIVQRARHERQPFLGLAPKRKVR